MANSPTLGYGRRRCHLVKDQLAKKQKFFQNSRFILPIKKKMYIPLCLELQFQSFHPSEDENIKPSSKLTCLFHLTCDQWDTYNQKRNSPSRTPTLFKKSYEYTKARRTVIQQGIILMLKNKALKIRDLNLILGMTLNMHARKPIHT